jgi:hypothetical protein
LGIPDPFEAPVTPPQLTVAALRELLAAHGARPEMLLVLFFFGATGETHKEPRRDGYVENNGDNYDGH